MLDRVRTLSPALCCGLGLWLLFLVINPGRNEVTDAGNRLEVARAIWTEGHVSVAVPPRTPGDWFPTQEGRVVSWYGIGQSLLLIPFDMLGYLVVRVAGIAPPRDEIVRWLPIGLGLLPLLGVLWWDLLRRVLLEAGFSPAWALTGATLTLLASIALPYIISPQEECLVGCLLAAALLGSLRWRRSGRLSDALLAGLAAGACVMVRINSVLALVSVVPVFLMPVSRQSWRSRAWWGGVVVAGATACVGLAGVALYNYLRFGSVTSTGYLQAERLGKWALDENSPRLALGLLFGPGKGWFVLSPILLLSVFGFPALARLLPGYALMAPLSFLGSIALSTAMHGIADGPMSWGPRYQVHDVTLFALPLTFGLRALAGRWSGRLVLGCVVPLSLCIQLAAVFTTVHLEYAQNDQGTQGDNYRLIVSARDGQLGRRVRNIGAWLTEPARPIPAAPETAFERTPQARGLHAELIRGRYVPDFWGPVMAKRLSGLPRALVLTVWSVCLALACVLLAAAIRGVRRPVPFAAARSPDRPADVRRVGPEVALRAAEPAR
jgi:hypothetical protein